MNINELPQINPVSYMNLLSENPWVIVLYGLALIGLVVWFTLWMIKFNAARGTRYTFMGTAVFAFLPAMICLYIGVVMGDNAQGDQTAENRNSAAIEQSAALNEFIADTYGIDAGIQLDEPLESAIHPELRIQHQNAVYELTTLTDGQILLVDLGGQEVPRTSK